MKPISECRLYTFVDTAYLHGRDAAFVTQQLCDGGSDIIQLRAKTSSPDEVRRMAEMILPITERAGIPLVINDHLEIALEIGSAFCHLGQEDFFDAGHTSVSQLFSSEGRAPQVPNSVEQKVGLAERVPPKIGLSTHSPAQAGRALAAGPDYIAIGPIYATGTKPTAIPVTLEYVRWAAAHVQIPWFAIGGITLERLDDVLAAGAKRICVVSAILNAPDIAKACQTFKNRLVSAP